jgi:hypothetical protein
MSLSDQTSEEYSHVTSERAMALRTSAVVARPLAKYVGLKDSPSSGACAVAYRYPCAKRSLCRAHSSGERNSTRGSTARSAYEKD